MNALTMKEYAKNKDIREFKKIKNEVLKLIKIFAEKGLLSLNEKNYKDFYYSFDKSTLLNKKLVAYLNGKGYKVEVITETYSDFIIGTTEKSDFTRVTNFLISWENA